MPTKPEVVVEYGSQKFIPPLVLARATKKENQMFLRKFMT